MFKIINENMIPNHLLKMSFFYYKNKTREKRLESKPEGVFTYYAVCFPDRFNPQHFQMKA